jgi:hypothetical protein
MRWLRDNIRQGSWVALIALAINLALSFGHVHAIDAAGHEHHSDGLIAANIGLSEADHGQAQPDNDHGDHLCPICVATAAIANAFAPTPPVVQIEFTAATIDHAIESTLAVVEPRRAAFRSRGPPFS